MEYKIDPYFLKKKIPELKHLEEKTIFPIVDAIYKDILREVIFEVVEEINVLKETLGEEPTPLIYKLFCKNEEIFLKIFLKNISQNEFCFVVGEVIIEGKGRIFKKIIKTFEKELEKKIVFLISRALLESLAIPFLKGVGFSEEIIKFYNLNNITLLQKKINWEEVESIESFQ